MRNIPLDNMLAHNEIEFYIRITPPRSSQGNDVIREIFLQPSQPSSNNPLLPSLIQGS